MKNHAFLPSCSLYALLLCFVPQFRAVEYLNFVADALAFFMPAIHDRRTAIGIAHLSVPHPLGDLLRTVTRLSRKTWTPVQGKFELCAAELKKAHPNLRSALEAHARQSGLLVKALHLTRDGQRNHHRKVGFTFETAQLVRILQT